MKVLLIKTSSLGDVIHAMPAVTEAKKNLPDLELTWVVEESLADLPRLHPAVSRVIPVSIRRWRKSWFQYRHEVRAFLSLLRDTQYDVVIDSQGLMKSAVLAKLSRGERHGYDGESARESTAAVLYETNHTVAGDQHALLRQKQLMGASLGYESDTAVDYGIEQYIGGNTIMFLHGTTWASKEWPLASWQALASAVEADGWNIAVPAGSEEEKARAAAILQGRKGRLLDRLALGNLADELKTCAGVVSVDTGLGHLAAAMGLPLLGIFGATDPGLTAMTGDRVRVIVSNHLPCIPCKKRECQFPKPHDSSNIYPPCLEPTTPESVWQALRLQIGSKDTKPG